MHFNVRLIAILLTVGLTPGAAEAVENSVHLVRDGHLAHASEHTGHADEEPVDDEHGCNSVFHVCACHVSASFIVEAEPTKQVTSRSVAVALPNVEIPENTLGAASVELDGLLRPPIR